ncbi:MAG: CaiB/BaiF CoA transferase family protein [Acidimicrobiales bacterium]
MTEMLAGITVLELGQVIAGTYVGTLLADMGAEVIKVEPLTGDTARNATIAPMAGESTIHLCVNRGKQSVAIDLKQDRGRALFLDLVASADVVLDNFRPGVLARLGIDDAALRAVKPDIVTVSVTGFGEDGPARDRPAFDLVVQAYAGHLSITGEPDRPPSRVGTPLADLGASLFACIAVLGGLCGRLLHGGGRHVDVAMLDSLVSLLGYDAVNHLNTGETATRHGTAHAHIVPWQSFAVLDGYVVVAARDQKFWNALCEMIDRPDLRDDPRTADNAARVANRELVTATLEASFANRCRDELLEALDAHGVPAAPVNDLGEVFADPQVVARGLVQTYDHPRVGPVRYAASPLRRRPADGPHAHAPMLGEHTARVLRERLQLDDTAIDQLAADRVIGLEEPA